MSVESATFDGDGQRTGAVPLPGEARPAGGFRWSGLDGAHHPGGCQQLFWREWDAIRNSIRMAVQALYSHKLWHRKHTAQMQAMLWRQGITWREYPVRFSQAG
jgi:hypothetical protein